jgi:hypothetical protein
MKVSHLLAAVAILGMAGFAMAAKGGNKGDKGKKGPAGLMGKITAVDATNMTVKSKDGDVTYTLGTAKITVDGVADKTAADLAVGMMVAVTPKTAGAAETIIAKTPAAKKDGGKKGGKKNK